jgi:hypothetical protein
VIHHELEDAARVEETVNMQELYVRNDLGQDDNVKVGWIGLA